MSGLIDEISDNGIILNDGTSFTFNDIVGILRELNSNYCSPDAVRMPRSLQIILDGMPEVPAYNRETGATFKTADGSMVPVAGGTLENTVDVWQWIES